jgi:hypothetical protein
LPCASQLELFSTTLKPEGSSRRSLQATKPPGAEPFSQVSEVITCSLAVASRERAWVAELSSVTVRVTL